LRQDRPFLKRVANVSVRYGLGYGRTERAPERVLPFFPAFLASPTTPIRFSCLGTGQAIEIAGAQSRE